MFSAAAIRGGTRIPDLPFRAALTWHTPLPTELRLVAAALTLKLSEGSLHIAYKGRAEPCNNIMHGGLTR